MLQLGGLEQLQEENRVERLVEVLAWKGASAVKESVKCGDGLYSETGQ